MSPKKNRKNRNRRPSANRQKTKFEFGRLEPRQLLTADLIGPQYIQVDAGLAPEKNLIINGDFTEASNDVNRQFPAADVPGWDIGSSGNQINLLDHPNLSHGNVLNLDSAAGSVDTVGQEVATTAGQEYVLSFELRERPVDNSADAATNDVDVLWNGDVVGTYRGIEYWQTISLNVTANGASSRLEFRESTTDGGDGRGPLIDSVRLVAVSDMAISNGSFENVSGAGPTFAESAVDGWGVFGPSAERNLEIVTGDSTDGSRHLQLDSSGDNVNRLFRDIDTAIGNSYFVMFDLRGDSTADAQQNELRVRWNGEWAGTYDAGDDWQSFGILVDADSDNSRLVLREPGSFTGDGSGLLIDNVRVLTLDSTSADLNADLNGAISGNDFNAAYFENSGKSSILTNQIELSNSAGANLTGLEVRISNPLDGNAESLEVTPGSSSIVADYDQTTGLLTLSGTDTVERYESVLRTLTYENTSSNPDETTRLITVTLIDNGVESDPSTINLAINSTNDAPTIDPIADISTAVNEPFTSQIRARDAEGSELTFDLQQTGSAIFDGGIDAVIDSEEGILTWRPLRSGTAEFTITITDDEGLTATESFTVTAELRGDVPGDFVPFSGNRQLSTVEPSQRDGIYTSAPALTINTSSTYTAVIETAEGEMTFDLFPSEAPLAVNNFVNLANDGFYDGLSFHRVIEGFVAQGGDPAGNGTGGPGYTFADEFDSSLRFDGSGVLAMANSGANTNGSQFFVTYGPTTHLNDVHTIFGQLTGGQNVLDSITRTQPGDGIPSDIMYSVTIIEN